MEIGKIKVNNKLITINSDFIKFNNIFLDNFTKLSILIILAGYNNRC